MKTLTHMDVHTIDEACTLMKRYGDEAVLNPGGTDLLSIFKGKILNDNPKIIINIKTILSLNNIKEDGGYLKIGALIKLSDIAKSPIIKENYRVLSDGVYSLASPQIRNMATIRGNLNQDVRCWYYRYPHVIGGPLNCTQKGEGPSLAVKGDNRYHM
jgi:xanthine dehydrogenase YagS FAD-binding subunit